MKILIGIIYIIILGVVFFIEYKKEKNLFFPTVFFILLQFLKYPYGLLFKNYEHYAIIDVNSTLKVVLCNLIYTFFYIICFRLLFKKIKVKKYTSKESNVSTVKIFSIYGIGLASKIYVIAKIGGLSSIFSSSSKAYSAQSAGYGYFGLLYKFMLFAILLMLEKYYSNHQKKYLIYTVFMGIIYMISFFIYTSRGPALELILIIVIVYNFCRKKINLGEFINIKSICLIFLIGFISMELVNNRNKDNNSAEMVDNVFIGLFDEYSRVGRDAFTYQYFDNHELLYGKSIKNVLTAFIPSSLYTKKPIIDDGLFLINVMTNHNAKIDSNINDLFYKNGSIPFTTQGIMYANFSYLGLAIAGILLAIIHIYSYKKWALSKKPINICMYSYIIYMFGLTPLYIINTLQIFVIFIIIDKLSRMKIKYN